MEDLSHARLDIRSPRQSNRARICVRAHGPAIEVTEVPASMGGVGDPWAGASSFWNEILLYHDDGELYLEVVEVEDHMGGTTRRTKSWYRSADGTRWSGCDAPSRDGLSQIDEATTR